MISTLRTDLRLLRDDEPGQRFVRRYDRHRGSSRAGRITRAILGFILAVAGVLMLVLPGPAIVVIPLGLAMVGGEVEFGARFLDRAELWLRRHGRTLRERWHRSRHKTLIAVIGAIVALAAIGAAGWLTWELTLRDWLTRV